MESKRENRGTKAVLRKEGGQSQDNALAAAESLGEAVYDQEDMRKRAMLWGLDGLRAGAEALNERH